jgi:hypothetical protein
MKKLLVLTIICAAGIISCGKKTVPESSAKDPSRSENEKTTKASGKAGTENATAMATTSLPTFNDMKQTISPDQSGPRSVAIEKGKSVYLSKCGTCHALKNVHDYSADRWRSILKTEIPRANLSNEEAEQVTAFLLEKTKK